MGRGGRDLLSRAISIKAFKTRDEQEVAGYAEAMDLVFDAHADMRLTEIISANSIRPCCVTATRTSATAAPTRRSRITSSPFDAPGPRTRRRFRDDLAFRHTPRMETLVAWTRKALDEEALHPLLIIAVFVVTFLAIHPFQDGNGRLSRSTDHAPLAASGLRLCAVCLAGAGDRGKQRAVPIQGAAAHADDAKKRNAGLGTLDWFFPALPQAAQGWPLDTARP